jgi:hypothetical protein
MDRWRCAVGDSLSSACLEPERQRAVRVEGRWMASSRQLTGVFVCMYCERRHELAFAGVGLDTLQCTASAR